MTPTPEPMPVYRQVIEETHRRTLDRVFHILAHQPTPADQETTTTGPTPPPHPTNWNNHPPARL